MNLGDFIDTFRDAIAQRVVESYPPLYRPSENGGTLPRLLRKPLGAQADAIRGAARATMVSPIRSPAPSREQPPPVALEELLQSYEWCLALDVSYRLPY